MAPIYSELNPARKEIRVVTLKPGQREDDIECSLEIVSLEDEPVYTALSYVWGSANHTVDIKVDGHVFPIRLNLEKVLRRVRSASESQVLWIDSICINQRDANEKSHQIQIMGLIYKSTKECLMWLGDVEDQPIEPFQPLSSETWNQTEAAVLERKIRELDLKSPEPLPDIGKEAASIDVPGAFAVARLLAQRIHCYEMPFFRILPEGGFELCPVWAKAVYSLENILRRTWWTRIWTAQEAFLPERGTIVVGPYTIPYSVFLDAGSSWAWHIRSVSRNRWDNCCQSIVGLWMGYLSAGEPTYLFIATEDLKVLRDARTSLGNVSVAHDLFLLTIQRAAAIQHDHVYGLFGLITEFFHFDEIPDYSLDLSRLYAAVTLRFMEKAQHLCLLSYARPHHHHTVAGNKDRAFLSELPSWCPDWNPSFWSEDNDYFDIYNYGGFTADKLQIYGGETQGEGILKLQGIHVGTIPTVAPSPGHKKDAPGIFVPILQTWVDLAISQGVPQDAVWELMHVATHKDVGLGVVAQQAAWWERLKVLAKDNATFEEMVHVAEENEFKHHVSSMESLPKRALFAVDPVPQKTNGANHCNGVSEYESTLSQGTIGFSRPGVQPGDHLFIVKGARTPLVFRSLAGESLRPKALNKGIPEHDLQKCFAFVGTSYVYGMMQGQALGESPAYGELFLI